MKPKQPKWISQGNNNQLVYLDKEGVEKIANGTHFSYVDARGQSAGDLLIQRTLLMRNRFGRHLFSCGFYEVDGDKGVTRTVGLEIARIDGTMRQPLITLKQEVGSLVRII